MKGLPSIAREPDECLIQAFSSRHIPRLPEGRRQQAQVFQIDRISNIEFRFYILASYCMSDKT